MRSRSVLFLFVFQVLFNFSNLPLFGSPLITSVDPNRGPTAGGTVVQIHGSGFTGATQVLFGEDPATSFLVINDTLISAVAPQSAINTVSISVTTASGTSPVASSYYAYQGNWSAYVCDYSDNAVYPISIPSNTVGTVIPGVPTPRNLAITPDNKTVLVTNSNAASTVTPIHAANNTALPPIVVGGTPDGIAITPNGQAAYVACQNLNAVVQIAIQNTTYTPQASIAVPTPTGVAITPNGLKGYICTFDNNTVVPFALPSLTLGTPIVMPTVTDHMPSTSNPVEVAITPDGLDAYVTLSNQLITQIADIDVPTDTFVAFGTGTPPSTRGTEQFPLGIDITPDNAQGFFAAQLVAAPNNPIVSRFPIPANLPITDVILSANSVPSDYVSITPDGLFAYATARDGNVYPVSTQAPFTVGTPIPITNGSVLFGIAITPDPAPIASFTVVPQSGSTVTFDASNSVSPVGTIASYEWNFGDGVTVVTTNPIINHTYATQGDYIATLTVTNTAGTSTRQIFTGRTVKRNGGPSATTFATVSFATGGPTPPTNFVGRVRTNEFATQTEYSHLLTWTPSTDTTVAGYILRRNGHIIARIPANGPFRYNDHNRREYERDVYTLVAVNAAGVESQAVEVIVPCD